MEVKYICKQCSIEVKEKSNFCPHCGKRLKMIETTHIVNIEIRFIEKPTSCSSCRFGNNGYESYCLLNPDIIFSNYNGLKYYGRWGNKIAECPIDKK